MSWEPVYLQDAEKDYKNLDRRQQLLVDKAIDKVKENPLPQSEGGYGKPLGHKKGQNLTGYLKIIKNPYLISQWSSDFFIHITENLYEIQ